MTNLEEKNIRLLLKDCAIGFYQQMYFLGKDVLHPSGNQLLEYGFLKTPSTGLRGTSCYTYSSGSDVVELYGSCAATYTDKAKVVFLRPRCRFYEWLPDHRLVAGKWSQSDLQSENFHSVLDAVTPLLQWWVKYEKWIESRLGNEYRDKCFKEWNQLKSMKPWLPPEKAIHWVTAFLEDQASHVRAKIFNCEIKKF